MGNWKRNKTDNEYNIRPGESQKHYYARLKRMDSAKKEQDAIAQAKANGTYLEPAVVVADAPAKPISKWEIAKEKGWKWAWDQFRRKLTGHNSRTRDVVPEDIQDDGYHFSDFSEATNQPFMQPLDSGAVYSLIGHPQGAETLLGNPMLYLFNPNGSARVSEWKARDNDYEVGDNHIPRGNFSRFWGIEDGTMKMGPLDSFRDTTMVNPVLNKETVGITDIKGLPASEYDAAVQQYDLDLEALKQQRDSLYNIYADRSKAVDDSLFNVHFPEFKKYKFYKEPTSMYDVSNELEAQADDEYRKLNSKSYYGDWLNSADGYVLTWDENGKTHIYRPKISPTLLNLKKGAQRANTIINKGRDIVAPYENAYQYSRQAYSDLSWNPPTNLTITGTDGKRYYSLKQLYPDGNTNSGKVMFANQNAGVFINNLGEIIDSPYYRQGLQDFIQKYGPVYPVIQDNGSFYKFIVNPSGQLITSDQYNAYNYDSWGNNQTPLYVYGTTWHYKNGGILKRK